ncbi:Ldh family oxidoreductase [Mesorhizobium sp. B2-9-1]|uniref:Ldh family oxidoreductase n=1 Tax=unclassified Mesorhizobium TaxID=325217 RepID=UPI0011293909|nr:MULTISPECIES: Ldh family oxidoreductase [unclassified Mesorhizobium]TPI50043.1 Ldh family oxidoreductase [Mesorhizobium sp. B2-9-1]TPJ19356.1 Ldh family oxidoreductase [Mesorhizobium sp. B2-7-2]
MIADDDWNKDWVCNMETFENVQIRHAALEAFCSLVLQSHGASESAAAACARALSEASLRGVDTHGVRLLPLYVQWIKGGRLNTSANIKYSKVAPGLGVVDADGGFGHVASYRAVNEAIVLAKETGIGAVAVHRTSHHGATGTYALHGASQGFVTFGFTQSGPGVVAHSGREPFHGTNPIAFAVPLEREEPVLLDMATSSIPLNRIYLRRDTGTQLPEDVAVDQEGRMTTDPHRAVSLLPLGGVEYGYKGAGLATMVELLCTMFTGSAAAVTLPALNDVSRGQPSPLGHFFLVLDGARFRGMAPLLEVASSLVTKLRACESVAGGQVMAPGDPEKLEKMRRSETGVLVDRATWLRLSELANEKALPVPATLA